MFLGSPVGPTLVATGMTNSDDWASGRGPRTNLVIALTIGHTLRGECRGTKVGGNERYSQPTASDS